MKVLTLSAGKKKIPGKALDNLNDQISATWRVLSPNESGYFYINLTRRFTIE